MITDIETDYIKRHPSKNLFSLETLIFNKFIKCELYNRPINLRSRLQYSCWIETDPIKKEYTFFTMDRNILLSKQEHNTHKGRIALRKYYETLINKDFLYQGNNRIESPHRIFISTTSNQLTIRDLKRIVADSLNSSSSNNNKKNKNSSRLKEWNEIINSIYHWDIPIDSYYCLGNYPRHDEVFTTEYLSSIFAIGKEYSSINNNFNTLFTNKVVYSYKNSKKMNLVLFDKSRSLYYTNDRFQRLFIFQLKLTNHQFYQLDFSYDYCYTNIIRRMLKEDYTLSMIEERYFKYEYSYNSFRRYCKPIINRLGINNPDIVNELFEKSELEDHSNEQYTDNNEQNNNNEEDDDDLYDEDLDVIDVDDNNNNVEDDDQDQDQDDELDYEEEEAQLVRQLQLELQPIDNYIKPVDNHIKEIHIKKTSIIGNKRNILELSILKHKDNDIGCTTLNKSIISDNTVTTDNTNYTTTTTTKNITDCKKTLTLNTTTTTTTDEPEYEIPWIKRKKR